MFILAIDDEESVRELIKIELEEVGHEVIIACNGLEGICIFEESYILGKPFDLIIVDIKMPFIDGIETMNRIKTIDKAIPVVIHTAFGEFKRACEKLSVGFVQKSHDFSILKTIVEAQFVNNNN